MKKRLFVSIAAFLLLVGAVACYFVFRSQDDGMYALYYSNVERFF